MLKNVLRIEIILTFAQLKEPKVTSFTIGEKGIRWKSETIPVAVSPILVASYIRSRIHEKGWMLDALFATDLRDWEGATTDKSEDLP